MSTDTSPSGTNTDTGQDANSGDPAVTVNANQDPIDQESAEKLFDELQEKTNDDRQSASGGVLDVLSDLAGGAGTAVRGAASASGASAQTAEAQLRADDLFRHEAAISQMDLRLEIAHKVDRYVKGDEKIALDERFVHAWADLSFVSGSRSRTVEGDYTRITDNADVFVISHSSYTEEVHGGVSVKMNLESEAIMGGGYLGTVLGPFMRICGWTDFLAWGGWGEADAVRVEVGNVMIRSTMNFVHTAGYRGLTAYNYFDDFTMRVENFGLLQENHSAIVHAGSPASGITSYL